jgi:hypothetical protein
MKRAGHLFPIEFPMLRRIRKLLVRKLRLHQLKSKIIIMSLIFFIASAGIGLSYAQSNGGINCDSVAESYYPMIFTDVSVSDNEVEKFIGEISADIDTEGKTITVDIDHAYPSYEVYIDFTIMNTGDTPAMVHGLTASSYDDTAMSFSLSGFEGVDTIPGGGTLDATLTITVLNTALQNSEYPFSFSFGFSGSGCDSFDCSDPIGTINSLWLDLSQFFKNLC